MKTAARIVDWGRLLLLGFFLVVLMLFARSGSLVQAAQPVDQARLVEQAQPVMAESLVIHFFWSNTCPHCAEAKPWLADLEKRYPQVQVKRYEVHEKANQALYFQMAEQYQVPTEERGVPLIIIGQRYWVGYTQAMGQEMEAFVKDSLKGVTAGAAKKDVITVPLLGEVNLAGQSLTVSTLLISFVDGVNPCSVWVLTMLLALTLHTGSRRKVVIIGLIFLTVTAAVYAAFIAGLFTVLSLVSFVGWIQVVVALMALFFGLVNIKDYFWYKEGLSFTIADEQKPGIFKRMRRVMDASQSFWGLAGATVVMSAGVSLVEFSCTAGFPVLWTNLLASQKVTALTFGLLLLLYMFIYQLDELVIFFTAVFSLKASKLEEKHGRILKLIGGVLMLTLAGVMLINPALMNSLSSSLLIFLFAFLLMLLVLVLHRKILPAFGIWLGSEAEGRRRVKRHARKAA